MQSCLFTHLYSLLLPTYFGLYCCFFIFSANACIKNHNWSGVRWNQVYVTRCARFSISVIGWYSKISKQKFSCLYSAVCHIFWNILHICSKNALKLHKHQRLVFLHCSLSTHRCVIALFSFDFLFPTNDPATILFLL